MTGVMKPEVDVYSSYYGLDPSVLLAVMSSAYFYTYALSQIFMGPMVDYYGVKRSYLIMLLLLGVGTMVMSLPSPWTLIIGRSLIGFSASVVFLSYMRSSALYFSLGEQGMLSSYILMVGGISTILTTYPLRMALNIFGIQITFMMLAIASFIIALLIYVLAIDIGGGYRSIVKQLREVLEIARDIHVWGVGLAALTSYGTVVAYQSSWGQIHISKSFGLGYDEVSIYLMIIALVFALLSIATGYLSDKVVRRRKPFLTLATSITIATWIIMYIATIDKNIILLKIGLIAMGISQGLHIVAPTMVKEPYSPQISGTVVSLFNIIVFIGIAIMQTICSITSPTTAITINMIIAVIGTVASIMLTKETYIRDRS